MQRFALRILSEVSSRNLGLKGKLVQKIDDFDFGSTIHFMGRSRVINFGVWWWRGWGELRGLGGSFPNSPTLDLCGPLPLM